MSESVRGTVEDAMTLNIDLTPTILAAAGLKPSSFMQGRDMAPLYLDQSNNEYTKSSVVTTKSRRITSSTTNDEKDDRTTIRNWRQEWFYEFNMGKDVENATDHQFIHFIDASFALITKDWKYIAVRYPEEVQVKIDRGEKFNGYQGEILDLPYLTNNSHL